MVTAQSQATLATLRQSARPSDPIQRHPVGQPVAATKRSTGRVHTSGSRAKGTIGSSTPEA